MSSCIGIGGGYGGSCYVLGSVAAARGRQPGEAARFPIEAEGGHMLWLALISASELSESVASCGSPASGC